MDRVAEARVKVQSVKAELHSGAAAFPCINCRYYELVCTHPAVAEFRVDPETGKGKMKPEFAKVARSETGPCGPDGALFDSRSPLGLTIVSAITSHWTWWAGAFLLAAVGDSLLR